MKEIMFGTRLWWLWFGIGIAVGMALTGLYLFGWAI